jgi:hypothetical protein
MPDAPKPVKLFTVAEMWEDYQLKVVPAEAPEIQVRECRRAFYAGAASMYIDCTFGIGDPSVPEKVGEAHLEKIWEELQAFKRAVGKGT